MAEDTGRKDTPTTIDNPFSTPISLDGYSRGVMDGISLGRIEGWQDCLRMVRGSIKGYPDHGGDQAIMDAIQKIEDAAFIAGGNAVHE